MHASTGKFCIGGVGAGFMKIGFAIEAHHNYEGRLDVHDCTKRVELIRDIQPARATVERARETSPPLCRVTFGWLWAVGQQKKGKKLFILSQGRLGVL